MVVAKDEHLTSKQREWLGHIQACELSGKTMREYAQSKDLDLKRLYHWNSRLKRLGLAGSERQPIAFKRIAIRRDSDLHADLRVIFPSGIVLEAGSGVGIDRLGALLKSLSWLS